MRRLFPFILLTILSFWVLRPLFEPGFFPMHDDQQIARLYDLHKALVSGHFPPRWVSNLGFGYGYPLFNFYPPLVYYLGEIFHLFGFSLINSIKIVMGLGLVLSSFSLFVLAGKFVSPKSALLASLLYLYAPYRSLDVYVRGALAESFAFVFYPLILFFIFNIFEKKNIRSFLFLSFSFAGLILTHSLMVFPFSVFLLLILFSLTFFLRNGPKIGNLLIVFFSLFFGFLITSYFSLPSIFEKKYTLVDEILIKELANYQLHFVYLRQLINSAWGYGGSIYGLLDGISFEIGKIHLILLITPLFYLLLVFWKIISPKKNNPFPQKILLKDQNLFSKIFPVDLYLIIFLISLFFSIFLASFHSQFLWHLFKPLWYIQFPWRFLSFTALFIPLVIVISLEKFLIRPIYKNILLIIFIVITILFNSKYFKPSEYLRVNDAKYTAKKDISWRISKTSFEFIPKGVKTIFSDINTTQIAITEKEISPSLYTVLKGKFKIKEIQNSSHRKIALINTPGGGILRINLFNFQGWKVYLNGKEALIDDKNKLKLITIVLPKGDHKLVTEFEDTPVRTIGNYLSIISLILLAIIIFISKIKFHNYQ